MTRRIAIAGTGTIAGIHAQALRAMAQEDADSATLVAVCGRDQQRTSAFADQYAATAYTDLETMLSEARPDVLCIATPSGTHVDVGVVAAKHGVHVLCEKPLDISTKRADQLIAACADAGVRLGGIFQQRMRSSMRRLHQAIREGRFGGPLVMHAMVPWWREDSYYQGSWQGSQALDGGGALINQAIHTVDLIQWFAQAASGVEQPVVAVEAMAGLLAHSPDDVEVEDTALLNIELAGGSLAQITASTAMFPGSSRRISVGGRDGTVVLEDENVVCWSFRETVAEGDAQGASNDSPDRESPDAEGVEGAEGAADPGAIPVWPHQHNMSAFLKSLDATERFALDGQECRKSVALIEAAYEAVRTGRRQFL